ncbi:MAG: hypothetical protein HKN46_01415 [Acidimicrobiia bacterium]|nr:hypothetical protein [Acidimicrobiia bacterium]
MGVHAQPRNGSAAVIAVLLMGLGLAAAWWAMAPVVLGVDTGAVLDGAPLAPAAIVAPQDAPLAEGARISTRLQTAQPRDPFVPLVGEAPMQDTDGDGIPDDTVPDRTQVMVEEIVDVDGVPRANIVIDGITYTVGEGDEFAGSYKVIDLDVEGQQAVLMNGDSTFVASAGQAILK